VVYPLRRFTGESGLSLRLSDLSVNFFNVPIFLYKSGGQSKKVSS